MNLLKLISALIKMKKNVEVFSIGNNVSISSEKNVLEIIPCSSCLSADLLVDGLDIYINTRKVVSVNG